VAALLVVLVATIGLASGTLSGTSVDIPIPIRFVMAFVVVIALLFGVGNMLLRRGSKVRQASRRDRAERTTTPQLANDAEMVSALLQNADLVFAATGKTVDGSYRASLLLGTVLGLVLLAGLGVLFVGIGRGTLQLAASGGVPSTIATVAGLVMRPDREIRENSRVTQRFGAARGRCEMALTLCLKSGKKAERRECVDVAWQAFLRDLKEA
jgi:hypothetical protein